MNQKDLEAHVIRAAEHYRMVKAYTEDDLNIIIEIHQNGLMDLLMVTDPDDLAFSLRERTKRKAGGQAPTCLIFNGDMSLTEVDLASGLPASVSQALFTIGVALGLDPVFRGNTYWDTGNGLAFESFVPDQVLDPGIVATLQSCCGNLQ